MIRIPPHSKMATSSAAFASIFNVRTSKIANPNVGFPKFRFLIRKNRFLIHFRPKNPVYVPDNNSPSSSCSCNSAAIANSLTLDQDSINDEELKKAQSKLGSKVRVRVPLKVYHVPKVAEYDLTGQIGVVKQYVGVYKGKRISANLPYKVEFEIEGVLGRDGNLAKFIAHLREDEFEFLD